jgi:V/A-type H+-transporting ATPase subunit C
LTQTTRYAQVLAKIGAERSKLLSEAKIKTLTETKKLSELSAQLRDTSYQEQITKLPLPLTSRTLERAFHENLIATTVKIIKNSPRQSAKYLSLYLYRFEAENIKTLIKTTNAKLNREQKLAKLYLSAEDYLKNRAVIEEAAKAETIKQIVNVLKRTEYALALGMGQQSYEEDGSTTCLDVLIDKVFHEKLYSSYVSLSKNEKAKAYFYASMENDGFTLLTLLRGKNLNYDPNWLRLAVPPDNFNIYADTVEEMVTAVDFESALKIALDSYYGGFFVRTQNPEDTLANAEKAFKKAILEHAKASRVSENFNLGSPLSYLTQKEVEVHNLTAISSGVEAAVKPEDIQTQLSL